MSYLTIEDLNFCQTELPETEEVKGGFFGVNFATVFASAFNPSGDAAAGYAAGVAVAIGDNIQLTIGTESIS